MKDKVLNAVKYNKHFMLLFISLAIFALILINVLNGSIVWFDNSIYSALISLKSDFMTGFFKTITKFADEEPLILIAIVCLIVIKNRKIGASISVNLVTSAFVNHLIKEIVQRPRPPIEFRMVEESSFSFPSGHAMTSATFYGLIIYFVFKNVKNNKVRNIICTVLSLLIFLIGISRIYLGVHYASDVLAGFAFGIIYLVLYITFVLKSFKIRKAASQDVQIASQSH